MRLSSIFVGLLCPLPIAVAAAQSPARYLVAPDTLHYESDNPYRMYWTTGTDTTGTPQRGRSIETHLWRGPIERPRVVVRDLSLDVSRRTRTDTFTLATNGRVELINQRAPSGGERIDLLLTLPSTPLAPGVRWTDTVRATGTDPGGAQVYEVIRQYRVVRLVDTLGARGVADIAGEGTIRMRAGFWVDSAAGTSAWVDVAGPVSERYLFDVNRGRLVRRQWTMDLRGRGVGPTSSDTVIAGLRSGMTLTLTDSPRVRFLLADLPGSDTSVTLDIGNGAPILLHTVSRTPTRITSSLVRNDGTVGVASVTFARARPTGFEATWADTAGGLVKHRASVRGDSIVLQRSGRPDTVLAIPDAAWGIADHGMPELLAPVLTGIRRDLVPQRIDVLRPHAGRWERAVATARDQAGVVMAMMNVVANEDFHLYMLSPEGDLLFDEGTGRSKSRRVPADGIRLKVLEAAVKRLNGGG